MPGSSATPQMSLSRWAPASRAAAATAGLVVSMEMTVPGSSAAIGADDRHDARDLLVGRDGARDRAGSRRPRRRGGPRRPPPCGAPGRGPPPRDPLRARRPSPEKLSGVTLRIPMIQVRRPQSSVRGPTASGRGAPGRPGPASAGSRTDGVAAPPPRSGRAPTTPRSSGRCRSLIARSCPVQASSGSRSAGSSTSRARAAPTRYSEPATTTGSAPRREGEVQGVVRGRGRCGRRRPGARPARPRRGPPRAARAAGRGRCRRRGAREGPRGRAAAATTPVDVLVGHGRPDERQRQPGASRHRRRGAGAGRRGRARERGRRPGCGRRRGGPRGLAGARHPYRRRSSRRPGQRAAAYPSRRASGGTVAMPAPLERVEQPVRDRRVRGLVAAAEPHVHRRPGRGRSSAERVPRPAEDRGRRRHGQRHAQPRAAPAQDRERLAVRARSRPRRRA